MGPNFASAAAALVGGVVDAVATVSAATPTLPPLVAEMDAVPVLSAVTNPVVETVATAVLELLKMNVRPVRIWPAASRAIAVALAV